DLSGGDGVVELGTFLAAISATVASGFLAFYFRGHQEQSGIALLGCTLLGLAASFGISRVPAANPARQFNRHPLGDLGEQIHTIRSDRVLCWAVVGNLYLWFLAALLQFTIVIYGHDILRIDERHISYLQAAVAIGIGLGSLATGYLSDAKIEYGPDPARKGGVISAANLISFVGVFAAAGAYFALAEGLRLRADEIFFAGACMTLAATFYAVVFLPDSMSRLVLWVLTHSIYSIRVEGRDNIPERGGALFVVNKLTLPEARFLSAATARPIRFVADRTRFTRIAPPIRRALRVTHLPENDKAEFLRAVSAAFSSGEVLCLGGEAASVLLEDLAERERLEECLRETRSRIVLVSVEDAKSGPLQSEDGHLHLATPRLHSRVTLRFRAPPAPSENLAFAEALSLLKAAPA